MEVWLLGQNTFREISSISNTREFHARRAKIRYKDGKKKFHHSMEWVVSFKNEKITDKTKQTLYIFVNMHGEITGANYSGQ